AWWTFRIYGLPAPRVLDGGLDAWIAAGGTLESGPSAPPTPVAPPELTWNASLYADEAAVAAALADDATTVVDARAAARFAGAAPEPRAGLRAGHMPGAANLPFTALLDAVGRIIPNADSFAGPTIATCGSGVSACVLALSAAAAGAPDVAIYDGSWSEWGREDGPEVATGA
ncbi:MAG: rhodanese-like domain-containing protein, partial [Pseudomonadota bacterium]